MEIIGMHGCEDVFAIGLVGMQLGTDFPSTFEEKSNIKMIGFDMIQNIAGKLYKETGLGPNDVQVNKSEVTEMD